MLVSIPTEIGLNLAAEAFWAFGGASTVLAVRLLALDARLSGRWEGDLACSGPTKGKFQSHIIRCVLVLARPIARQNSGLLYYARECTATDKVIVRGLDELKDYKRTSGPFRTPEFTMEFIRRFHKHPDGEFDESVSVYNFHCQFVGLLSRAPKLYLKTEIPNGRKKDTWEGVFQKQ